MKWQQGAMLTFLVIDVCVSTILHGQVSTHNGGASLFVASLYFFVLFTAGFWD